MLVWTFSGIPLTSRSWTSELGCFLKKDKRICFLLSKMVIHPSPLIQRNDFFGCCMSMDKALSFLCVHLILWLKEEGKKSTLKINKDYFWTVNQAQLTHFNFTAITNIRKKNCKLTDAENYKRSVDQGTKTLLLNNLLVSSLCGKYLHSHFTLHHPNVHIEKQTIKKRNRTIRDMFF